jgi:hypothetical protein
MNHRRFIKKIDKLSRKALAGRGGDKYNDYLRSNIASWRSFTRQTGLPGKPGDNAIVRLLSEYDMSWVKIGNFAFVSLAEINLKDLLIFMNSGATAFYIARNRDEVHAMYYKEAFPAPLGQNAARFLDCLADHARYLTEFTLDLTEEEQKALADKHHTRASRTKIHFWQNLYTK